MILFLELTSSLLFIKFQRLLFDPVCSFVSDSLPLLFCCYIGLYLSDNVEGAFRILFSLYLDCVPKDTLFSFFGCCFRSFPEMLGCPWLHAHTEELMWKSVGSFRFLSRTGQLWPSLRGDLADRRDGHISYILWKSDHPMSSSLEPEYGWFLCGNSCESRGVLVRVCSKPLTQPVHNPALLSPDYRSPDSYRPG